MKKRLIALLFAVMLLVMAIPVFAGAEEEGVIVNVRNSANIRSEPNDSKSSKILGTAKRGSVWKTYGTVGEYTKVQYKGKDAYIYTKFIDTNYTPPTPGKSVKISNCTWCTVREKATSSSKKLGEAKKGDVYELLAIEGSWYKIQYTASQVGYVYRTYVQKTSEPGTDETKSGYGYVTGNTVNVRAAASSSSEKKGVAKKNEVYEILAKNGKWYKINFKGDQLYIHSSYFKVATSDTGKKVEVVNCKDCATVRASASGSGKKLGTAKLSNTYIYIGKSGSYVRVIFNGKVGYIHKDYAKVS